MKNPTNPTTEQGAINPERFDKTWRDICAVEHASAHYLREMVKQHYLGKWPAVITESLGMFVGPFVYGMVIFAEAPKETSVRYGGKTWELARLWIRDEVPRNAETWLIAQAVRFIRANHPEVIYLVSYADPSVGHAGTIYKAANWKSDGMTDEGRKSPRCDYQDASGKKYSRKAHVPPGVVISRVPRISKHRFVYQVRQVIP